MSSKDHATPDRRFVIGAGLGAVAAAAVGTEFAVPASAATRRRMSYSSESFPWIIDCQEWNARPPRSTPELSGNTTNKIIVHHMAFPNVTDYSREHAIALAQDCQDLHMDDNGWLDTGQHFTVSRGGYVLEGRHRSLATLAQGERQVIAAHCPGENGNAIGIENEGTYVTETPTDMQIEGLTKLCVAVCQQYGLHAHDMFGHWDFRQNTQCPGASFYEMFPQLRRLVADGLGTTPDEIPARRWPDIWRFVTGQVVRVGQYLLNYHGYGLATDSVFGSATLAAVQDWQQRNGLPVDVDGTFTRQTWETLVPQIQRGDSGPAVSAIQFTLGVKEFDIQQTGVFDQQTEQAIQRLQGIHGLPQDGAVTKSTWCAITGGIVRESFLDS